VGFSCNPFHRDYLSIGFDNDVRKLAVQGLSLAGGSISLACSRKGGGQHSETKTIRLSLRKTEEQITKGKERKVSKQTPRYDQFNKEHIQKKEKGGKRERAVT
jgi:hypothetical protein